MDQGPYALVAEALEERYFRSHGPMTWVRDQESADILCVTEDSKIRMIITPDNDITFFITSSEHKRGYYPALKQHADVTDIKIAIPTNGEQKITVLDNNKKEKAVFAGRPKEVIRIQGMFDPNSGGTWHHLHLNLKVPDKYKPRELPKVPRNKIAEMRERIERMLKIGQVANKLIPGGSHIWGLLKKEPDPDKAALLQAAFRCSNAAVRAELLCSDDTLVWQCAAKSYTTTNTLIDSCRPQLYNALGLRAGMPAPQSPKDEEIQILCEQLEMNSDV